MKFCMTWETAWFWYLGIDPTATFSKGIGTYTQAELLLEAACQSYFRAIIPVHQSRNTNYLCLHGGHEPSVWYSRGVGDEPSVWYSRGDVGDPIVWYSRGVGDEPSVWYRGVGDEPSVWYSRGVGDPIVWYSRGVGGANSYTPSQKGGSGGHLYVKRPLSLSDGTTLIPLHP